MSGVPTITWWGRFVSFRFRLAEIGAMRFVSGSVSFPCYLFLASCSFTFIFHQWIRKLNSSRPFINHSVFHGSPLSLSFFLSIALGVLTSTNVVKDHKPSLADAGSTSKQLIYQLSWQKRTNNGKIPANNGWTRSASKYLNDEHEPGSWPVPWLFISSSVSQRFGVCIFFSVSGSVPTTVQFLYFPFGFRFLVSFLNLPAIMNHIVHRYVTCLLDHHGLSTWWHNNIINQLKH